MNSFCLSLAPNLRCLSLTVLEYEALIIPPALEIILLLFLIYMKRSSGRRHFLLVTDGAIYFILALIDMLSHIIPAVRNSLSVFRVLDTIIGSLSFLPLLLYTLYLFSLSYKSFLPALPRRPQVILKYFLILLILGVIGFNEVGSFVGITIKSFPSLETDTLAVGFTGDGRTLWLYFSNLTLALYIAIQMLYFLLAFYRMVKALLNQQRIEMMESDEHHFFNGIGFISVGIGIGAVETLVGFSQGVFGVPLARRILRLVARAFLIVGIVNGLDTSENFQNLTDELRGSRRSRRFSNLRTLITNPRHSTFRPWRASRATHSPYNNPDVQNSASRSNREQRVTVHIEKDKAPFLQIRFSALEFPSPAALPQGARARSQSEVVRSRDRLSRSSSKLDVSFEMVSTHSTNGRAKSAMPSFRTEVEGVDAIRTHPFRGNSRHDSGATVSDTVVRELASQFPGLPPRVTGKYRGSILGQRYEEDAYALTGISSTSRLKQHSDEKVDESVENALSPSNSIKRKPAPPLIPNPPWIDRGRNLRDSAWSGVSFPEEIAVGEAPASPGSLTTPWTGTTVYSKRHTTSPGVEGAQTFSTDIDARRRSRQSRQSRQSKQSQIDSEYSVQSAEWLAAAGHPQIQTLTRGAIEQYRSGPAEGANISANFRGPPDVPRQNFPPSRSDIPLVPRLSVGRVPMRMTPTPTNVVFQLARERVMSQHGSVRDMGDIAPPVDNPGSELSTTRENDEFAEGRSFFLTD